MKIDLNSNLPVYRKTAGQAAAKTGVSPSGRAAKTDVADFSRGVSATPAGGLASLKANILQEVAASAGADKLAALQERIRSGSYHPSTDEIVDAILSD